MLFCELDAIGGAVCFGQLRDGVCSHPERHLVAEPELTHFWHGDQPLTTGHVSACGKRPATPADGPAPDRYTGLCPVCQNYMVQQAEAYGLPDVAKAVAAV